MPFGRLSKNASSYSLVIRNPCGFGIRSSLNRFPERDLPFGAVYGDSLNRSDACGGVQHADDRRDATASPLVFHVDRPDAVADEACW